jgi:hypothetical protein
MHFYALLFSYFLSNFCCPRVLKFVVSLNNLERKIQLLKYDTKYIVFFVKHKNSMINRLAQQQQYTSPHFRHVCLLCKNNSMISIYLHQLRMSQTSKSLSIFSAAGCKYNFLPAFDDVGVQKSTLYNVRTRPSRYFQKKRQYHKILNFYLFHPTALAVLLVLMIN